MVGKGNGAMFKLFSHRRIEGGALCGNIYFL